MLTLYEEKIYQRFLFITVWYTLNKLNYSTDLKQHEAFNVQFCWGGFQLLFPQTNWRQMTVLSISRGNVLKHHTGKFVKYKEHIFWAHSCSFPFEAPYELSSRANFAPCKLPWDFPKNIHTKSNTQLCLGE